MSALKIGTRGSALALWQARTVAALIEARGQRVELVVIRTGGESKPSTSRPASSFKVGLVGPRRTFIFRSRPQTDAASNNLAATLGSSADSKNPKNAAFSA